MVASIPIQLKNLQVFTVIRVIFQLTEEIPCISAVVVALLSEPKPRIDYVLKAFGGSLTTIPGLLDMIEDTVNTIVTDIDLELKPQGKLTVTIVKVNGLKNHKMIGKSDPYVVIQIRSLFKVKTKTIDNNLNHVWDQTFELIAEEKETQYLFIEVFHKDNIRQDQRMGVAMLTLNELVADAAKEIELILLPKHDMCRYGGSGIGAGVRLIGTGLGSGIGVVGSCFRAVGSGLRKAGRFIGRTFTRSSKKNGSSTRERF
uniref:C2 domain-containing protein n=1 Tax=Solanum lycopersicum TaxID=4081 RepID=K4D0V4_SOLLC